MTFIQRLDKSNDTHTNIDTIDNVGKKISQCMRTDKNAWRLQRPITEEEIDSIIIAWACAFTSFHGGNEIAIASGRQLLCAGGGPSTVDAAETAVQRGCKYGKMLKGASFAADAFFPFTDAVEVLLKAGCTAGVAPAGGINEIKVIDLLEKNGIGMIFLPKDFRGFCRH